MFGRLMRTRLQERPWTKKCLLTLEAYQPSLKCFQQHPGLEKDASAATKIIITGGEDILVAAAGLSTGGLIGVVLAAVIVLAFAVISFLAFRGKFSRETEKEKLDEEKKNFQSKITNFFARIKTKKEDGIVSTEWEKV